MRQDHGRVHDKVHARRDVRELRRLLQRPRVHRRQVLRLRRVRPHRAAPPPPGGYDPMYPGGMYYYEDKQRYRYQSCNQCGDTKAKDHNGLERPGMCTSCGGDERLLIGDPKEESTYWDVGVCAPKCAEGEYFEGGMFECMAKSKAGEYCWSHYQWDPITGEASDIGGFMCTSGVCGSTVKDPFSHMGYMMGNEYCCNADAVKEVDGQCCGRCKQGSGECLEWETCPAPLSEDMAAAQAAAGTIIGSIKDEKKKKKAETLTTAAIAGEDIHKLAGKLKDSSGEAAIKSFYKNAAIDEKHGAAVATSLDGGWNQFLNPGGRRRLLAQYEFEVEVFFTETEVKDNSISLRTASTNLEPAGVKGVTMQEDVDEPWSRMSIPLKSSRPWAWTPSPNEKVLQDIELACNFLTCLRRRVLKKSSSRR